MVTLRKISFNELRPLVTLAFKGDEKLLSQYHISNGTLEHCVGHTFELIEKHADFYSNDIEFYGVFLSDEPIGFTVIVRNEKHPNELYSFGINVNYRGYVIKKSWINQVSELLGGCFYTVLWSKNERAIRFFENNGCHIDNEKQYLNEETKVLILCQQ